MTELWVPRHGHATEANFSAVIHDARFAGGIAASSQEDGFGGQLFMRDSLRVIDDLMERYPAMVRELFSILPQMQGTDFNPTTNEAPGALAHQTFRQIVGGRYQPEKILDEVEYWANKWGVEMQHHPSLGKYMSVYNTSDGPPLYLIELEKFSQLPLGFGILKDKFLHIPTGETRDVGQAAHGCIDFIMHFIRESKKRGSGLYAVPNTNPLQTSPSGVMRDGFDTYYHPEGEFGRKLDFSFVAYLENQALVHDALHAAARLFPDDKDVALWKRTAQELQGISLDQFFVSETATFVPAIDADGTKVDLKSNVMGELLNYDFLNTPNGPEYVQAIVDSIYSPDMMTPAGPRMLSLANDEQEGEYYAYQGTGAVWLNVNGIIAKGMRNKWGLPSLSYDLGARRTLGTLDRTRYSREVIFVDKATNEPIYRPTPERMVGARAIYADNLGMRNQTWVASAGISEVIAWQDHHTPERRGTWQYTLAKRALRKVADIPPADMNISTARYYIDTKRGHDLMLHRSSKLKLPA